MGLLKKYITQLFIKYKKAMFHDRGYLTSADKYYYKQKLHDIAFSVGLLHTNRIKALSCNDVKNFKDIEFRVFSQFGEDGILQFIINNIDIPHKIFVEFGVANYDESNTHFLLVNDNWQGLIMDGSQENISYIKSQDYFWRHNLQAIKAFITKDNINEIIQGAGISGDIGILSIDIGGNDYWVWDAIDVISPRIVICEWNSVYGPDLSVTIPYDVNFSSDSRYQYHYSGLHSGASLSALKQLGQSKGYELLGSNSAGNNAFFIRKDLSSPFQNLINNATYVESQFRDSKDKNGNMNYLSGKKRLNEIQDVEVYETNSKNILKIKDILKQ